MSNYQICALEDFLAASDEFMSPDEFMESMKPIEIDETIQIPEEHIFQHSTIDESEKVVEGEITKMLRIAPGILPPVDCFPKSYKPPKPAKQPDFIPNDRFNKIPILLDEKFFKFTFDDDNEIESVREVVNNLDGNSSANGTGKSIGSRSRSHQNRASRISNESAFEKCFLNVFTNDASDEDNCNVQSSPDSSSHPNQLPQATVKPAQQYYNARQLYELKRGKK